MLPQNLPRHTVYVMLGISWFPVRMRYLSCCRWDVPLAIYYDKKGKPLTHVGYNVLLHGLEARFSSISQDQTKFMYKFVEVSQSQLGHESLCRFRQMY